MAAGRGENYESMLEVVHRTIIAIIRIKTGNSVSIVLFKNVQKDSGLNRAVAGRRKANNLHKGIFERKKSGMPVFDSLSIYPF